MGVYGVCHICEFYFSVYHGETKVKIAVAEEFFLKKYFKFQIKSCNPD